MQRAVTKNGIFSIVDKIPTRVYYGVGIMKKTIQSIASYFIKRKCQILISVISALFCSKF
ncbi:hypothetical protein J32TS6_33450 [Virgibacillus pantothenticus]|nr:hypothetical protein J32TS6_33450 [Virgibacillus pantothenticus]